MDGGSELDAGLDSGPDAGEVDGGDSAVPTDGALDGSTLDAGPMPDAGEEIDGGPLPDFDAGPAPDPCPFVGAGTPCGAGDSCAAGSVCLDNGCGERRCYAAGGPCAGAADCPSGSVCEGGFCGRDDGSCTESRDCPSGFSCDGGACVDRRIACDDAFSPCPHGFLCDTSLSEGAPICYRANVPCAAATGCPVSGQCLDVTGDGTKICHWATGPNCRNNADCPVIGEVCGTPPVMREAACQAYGPCATASDCGSGFECVDLWGDGVPECVPTGGACAQQSDCAAGSVCAAPHTGGAPRCITSAL